MKKILLADDSITIQKVVELTFSEGDYQVICVGNGAQALKKVAEIRPNVVLLDVIMPEKNGYEVCEQIKRNPATAGIPVLLLTGTFEPFDRKRADLAGADGHLTKPFESQLLVSRVEELIAATPTLASDDAGGAMDIVSGGAVYHVDPAAGASLRQVTATPPAPEPLPAMPYARSDAAAPSHASSPVPDPGGGYVGFADVGFTEDRSDIAPDHFDDAPPAPPMSTVRLRREDLPSVGVPAAPAAPPAGGHAPTAAAGDTGPFSGEYESHFDLVDDNPEPLHPAGDPAGEWTPPPEAPPAETWSQDEVARPVAQHEPAAALPATLTPEAIELIAEKVVQRMSERVVREIAWEVIPQVAEAVVRDRIRELEEKPTD